MKKIAVLIISAILCSSTLYSQWSQHSVNYEGINTVFFTSKDTGFVGGYSGRILKTTDGGLNWSLNLNLGSTAFTTIYFPTKDTGYAALANGIQVYKSTDAGSTWVPMAAPAGSFEAMHFVNSELGYACGTASGIGAAIFKTINGGSNWTTYGLTPQTTVQDIQFITPQLGYAVGWTWSTNVGYFYKTIDGGQTWSTQTISALPEHLMFEELYFTDSLTGYIAGSKLGPSMSNYIGVVYKTIDGGANWTSVNIPLANQLFDLEFVNDSIGYAAGTLNGGSGCQLDVILKTENRGDTWSLAYNGPHIYGINSLYFPSEDIGYAFERCVGSGVVGSFLKYEANTNCFAHYTVDADSATSTFTLFVDSLSSSQAVSYFWDFGDGATSTLQNPTHIVSIDTAYNVCMTIYNTIGDSCTYCHLIGKDYLSNIIRTPGYTINCVVPDSTTDVNSTSFKPKEILLYPNPTDGIFHLKGQFTNAMVRVFDITGREILLKTEIENNFRIDLSSESSGIYIFELISKEGVYKMKLGKK